MLTDAQRADRNRRIALVLRHRLQCCAWLLKNGIRHVDITTCARVLGVSGPRVQELVSLGRLPITDKMPGGGKGDRYVAVLDLMEAPSALEAGRPLGWSIYKGGPIPGPYESLPGRPKGIHCG